MAFFFAGSISNNTTVDEGGVDEGLDLWKDPLEKKARRLRAKLRETQFELRKVDKERLQSRSPTAKTLHHIHSESALTKKKHHTRSLSNTQLPSLHVGKVQAKSPYSIASQDSFSLWGKSPIHAWEGDRMGSGDENEARARENLSLTEEASWVVEEYVENTHVSF